MAKKRNTTKLPRFNFSALDDEISFSGIWVTLRNLGIIGLIICAVLYFMIFRHNPIIFIPAALYFVVAIAGTAAAYTKLMAEKAGQWQRFLDDNNWKLIPGEPLEEVPTSLLSAGHSKKIQHVFRGKYDGRSYNALIYEYKTGFGRDEVTHSVTCLHYILDQKFPFLVLNRGSYSPWYYESSLPDKIFGTKHLQLEGGFNKNCIVTVQPGAERQVLEFLTPDFMSEFQSKGSFNLELQAEHLFLMQLGDFSEELMTNLFAASEVVFKQLSDISYSWQAASKRSEIQKMAAQAMMPRGLMLQWAKENPY